MNIETLKKRTEDKSTWDNGEWQSEPDNLEWVDETTGYSCLIKRGPTGALCGYVGVNKNHPAHGLSGYKSDFDIDEVISGEAVAKAKLQKQVNDIRVHGGITFNGVWRDKSSDVYWFGFDCSHAGDFSPKYDEVNNSINGLGSQTGWGSAIQYRNIDYVKEECRSLAEQLSKISHD